MVENVWGLTLESGVSIEAHGMLVATTYATIDSTDVSQNSYLRQFAITKDTWRNDDHAIVWRKQLKMQAFPNLAINVASLAVSKNLSNRSGDPLSYVAIQAYAFSDKTTRVYWINHLDKATPSMKYHEFTTSEL